MPALLRRASLLVVLFFAFSALLLSIYVPQNIVKSTVLSAVSYNSYEVSADNNFAYNAIDSPVKLSKDIGYYHSSSYNWEEEQSSAGAYYQLVDQELSKYSSSDFKKIGLRKIYLVDELKTQNGIATLGFADITNGYLYLNVLHDRAGTDLVRSTLHHEIGHFITIKAEGYTILSDDYWLDYGGYGLEEQLDYYLFPEPGLVTRYAKTSVAEDMAEVYAFMMSDGYRDKLIEKIEEDKILKNKVEDIESKINQLELDLSWRR